MDKLNTLIEYCNSNNRICPRPKFWDKLWNLLRNKKQVNSKWSPALPLILAAWNFTSNIEKKLRLKEHILWAEKNGQLDEIYDFIYSLNENEWYHLED